VVSITAIHTEISRYYFRGFGLTPDENEFFDEFFREFFGEIPGERQQRVGVGSGVIISTDGLILTNHHVIEGADQIKVTLADGREAIAQLRGEDVRSDLAVIQINAYDLPAVSLGNSADLRIGQWVMAIGNPFGFAQKTHNSQPTVTVGVVSALERSLPQTGRRDRNYTGLIQTDAAINPGNSGGPLVDMKGNVIGINVAIVSTGGGYEGLGFAMPINTAKFVLGSLIRGDEVDYGWLGVQAQDVDQELAQYFGLSNLKGAVIVQVVANSPAALVGLGAGDVILQYNNLEINNATDLINKVGQTKVGSSSILLVLHNGEKVPVAVKIGSRPHE